MSVQRKRLVLSLVLAGGAAVLVGGCGKPAQTSVIPPATTSVGIEIDDTVVTAKVKSALLADPDIKSFDLKVETRKGEVQLSGFVDSQAQVDRAIAATRTVEGVKRVDNGISLKAGTASVGNTIDDGIITARVKSALLADPSMKSVDIAVVTRKGEVQLSGFVDSQDQIDAAKIIANRVQGVSSVGNELNIKK